MTITGHEAGALGRAATLTLTAKEDLLATVQGLTDQVAFGAAQWDGAGARAFATAYAGWAEQHQQVIGALQWFHDQLRSLEALTVATDADLATSFGAGR